MEFKQALSCSRPIHRTLVTFANTAGCILLESIPKIGELGLGCRFAMYLAESIPVIQTLGTEPATSPVSRLLLALATMGEIGSAEIKEYLGLKDRTQLPEHCLFPVLKDDLIEYNIPDKPNSRLQKYRLTAKG